MVCVCLCVAQVSGEVLLPHSVSLLAPCLTGAVFPESTQGQYNGPGKVEECNMFVVLEKS